MKMRRFIRPGIVTLAVLGATVAGPLAGHTHASFSVCRTDPLVTFTNGQSVRLWANTHTSASNISVVTYNLQVPAKWTVKSITYDNAAPEKVNLTFDQQSGSYIMTANVSAKVSVTTDVWMAGNGEDSEDQDGPTNTNLTVDWDNQQ